MSSLLRQTRHRSQNRTSSTPICKKSSRTHQGNMVMIYGDFNAKIGEGHQWAKTHKELKFRTIDRLFHGKETVFLCQKQLCHFVQKNMLYEEPPVSLVTILGFGHYASTKITILRNISCFHREIILTAKTAYIPAHVSFIFTATRLPEFTVCIVCP